MTQLRLFLLDSDPDVAETLRRAFDAFPEVSVSRGDLLAGARNAVVSPANSFGFMDGGFDAALRQFFGPAVEQRVQAAIATRPEGYLPVGASLAVETGHPRVPYLVVAPTMLSPEAIDPSNCYRALRAVLRAAARDERLRPALFCPGLGTGVGQVPPEEAARQMASAYGDWKASARG